MSSVVKSLQAASRSHSSALKMYSLSPLNHLRMLAIEIGKGGVEAVPVDAGELQRIWIQVQAWLGSDAAPGMLPLEAWRRVPALLWWDHQGQQAISHFRLREGIAWAASMSVPRVGWIEALATAYTEASQAGEESHRWLGAILRQWCAVELHDSLEVWRRRDRDLEIWSPINFAAKLARKLHGSPKMSACSALFDAGLSSARSQSADLSRQAFIEYLRLPVAAAQGYEAVHLERVGEWKTLQVGDTDAFPKSLSAAVINGLLEPWGVFSPPDVDFQKRIKWTLEDWFGPASDGWTGHWNGASVLSRQILARWKILDVMEAFFQRVEDYASRLQKRSGDDQMLRHWSYRRPLWLAYYSKGVVTRARALIGRGMMEEFGKDNLHGEFGKAMAPFDSKERHHCGLLLEINGLLVIDISHNGKAYFFLPSNQLMPSISASSYDRDKIDASADEALKHQGSDTYFWQGRFADFIQHHTGVTVKPSEYSLRA